MGSGVVGSGVVARRVTVAVHEVRSRPALSADDAAVLVRAAMMAPSVCDTQPWRFCVADDAVEVYLDPRRVLPDVELAHRDAVISCGAALAGLELAAAHLGHLADVTLLPSRQHPNHLASVRRGRRQVATAEEERQYAALFRRRRLVRPFADRPVHEQLVIELELAAREHGVWAREVRGAGHRELVAETSTWAAGELLADPARRADLARWTDADLPWSLFEKLPRTEQATGRDVLLMLGTPGDAPADWLAAGRALQRVLLAAVTRGLAATLLTWPFGLVVVRRALVERVRLPGTPQVLMRVGHPLADRPLAPRRRLADVLLT